MSNTSNILNSWSLLAFAKSHGKMKVASLSKTDDQGNTRTWKSCVFENPSDGNLCFVSFSRNLGELSPRQISEQKSDLQVVKCLTKEGNEMYSLCRKGESSWQDVDLGL